MTLFSRPGTPATWGLGFCQDLITLRLRFRQDLITPRLRVLHRGGGGEGSNSLVFFVVGHPPFEPGLYRRPETVVRCWSWSLLPVLGFRAGFNPLPLKCHVICWLGFRSSYLATVWTSLWS